MERPRVQGGGLLDRLVEAADLRSATQILDSNGDPVDRQLVEDLRQHVRFLIRADLQRAGTVAGIARAVADRLGDSVASAASDMASAMVAHRAGRFQEALRLYDAAEVVFMTEGMELEAARLARTKIDAMMYLGRYQSALDLADRARPVFVQHGERSLLAQLETNVGNVYHRKDEYPSALEHYDLARSVFAELGDDFGLAQVDLNRANIFVCLNDFEQSRKLYRAARDKYADLGMELMIVQVDYSVAWLDFLSGRYGEAMSGFADVKRRSAALGDEAQAALCDLDSCEIYLQLNTLDDALESATAACSKFGRLKMDYEYAKGRMYAGIAQYHRGELDSAGDDLIEAREVFEVEGNRVYVALTNLYLSDLHFAKREFDQAMSLAREAEAIFSESSLEGKAAFAFLQQAKIELACGDLSRARALVRLAVRRARATEDRWLKYQALYLQSKVQAQSGQDKGALRSLTQAVRLIEGMRSSIRVDDYRTNFLKDKLHVYEDLIELSLRDPRPENLEETFGYVEAVKSRTLVDLLSRSVQARQAKSPAGNPQLYQEWEALREKLDGLCHRLNQYERREGQRPMHVGTSLRAGIRVHEQKLAKLLRQLQVEDPEFSSLQAAPRLGVDELGRCLASDEVLVEYFTTGSHVHAFLVKPSGLKLFPRLAERESTLELLRRLRYQIDKFGFNGEYVEAHARSMRISIDECLEGLYRSLIEPFEQELEGSRIVFIPHDFLHYLPLHALRSGRQYLIDHCEVSYAPSANVFKICAEKNGHGSMSWKWPALVLGVPDATTPQIAAEVEAVGGLMPGVKTLMGREATLAAFQTMAAEARFIHLASHAVFRQDNPLFSALRLGDGWLNFYHLYKLDLRSELVTLSACQTGINRVLAGDELVGLMRGFLYAGARSLLLSLWAVNDRSTSDFMELFYGELGRGATKRAALRSAQLGTKERYPNPYYWAPFILTGKP